MAYMLQHAAERVYAMLTTYTNRIDSIYTMIEFMFDGVYRFAIYHYRGRGIDWFSDLAIWAGPEGEERLFKFPTPPHMGTFNGSHSVLRDFREGQHLAHS